MNGVGTSIPVPTRKMNKAAFFRQRNTPTPSPDSPSGPSFSRNNGWPSPVVTSAKPTVVIPQRTTSAASNRSAGASATVSYGDPYAGPSYADYNSGLARGNGGPSAAAGPSHHHYAAQGGQRHLQRSESERSEMLADISGPSDVFGRVAHGPSSVTMAVPSAAMSDDEDGYASYSSGGGDRFTAVPKPSRRARQRPVHAAAGEDVRVARAALESPPPHVRHAAPQPEPELPDGESHESASGTSAQTGISASSLGIGGGLSSSTSTAITNLTNGYSPGGGLSASTMTQAPTLSSDEMLLALLAGQAAVDCGQMPIAGWEEVEAWKKELSLLSNRVDTLQQKHHREVKILTAARTLSKLNSPYKRLSKQTMESLEQSERRVDAAEKELLLLRDRESALRRRLMEHWAGVMAWEVRRLEQRASDASARQYENARAIEEAQHREYELTERLHVLESEVAGGGARSAETEQEIASLHSRLRDVEAELEHHTNMAESYENERNDYVEQLRRLHTEHDERTRELEIDLDGKTERIRQLEAERDGHSTRIRAFETQQTSEGERVRKLQAELERQAALLRDAHAEREAEAKRAADLESERQRRGTRITELEEIVQEMGRRERSLEEETTRGLGDVSKWHEEDRAEWLRERDEMFAERQELARQVDELEAERDELAAERDTLLGDRDALNRERDELHTKHTALIAEGAKHSRARDQFAADREQHAAEREAYAAERAAWDAERSRLIDQRDEHAAERAKLEAAATATSGRGRATIDRLGADLAALVGRPAPVPEDELSAAVDQARAMLDKRAREIANLKDELREVNDGMEAEVSRVRADRDAWKRKYEEVAAAVSSPTSARSMSNAGAGAGDTMELVRKLRSQNDEIAELRKRAGANLELETKLATVEAEISAVNTTLSKVWAMLPPPDARAEAGLSDPRVVSPNSVVNFSALQKAYQGPPASDTYPGVDELVARVQGVVDDGRIMVERMARTEVDKERHKANAAKAAKLVTDARHSLETYQKQVADLESRLARGSSTQSERQLRADVDGMRAALHAAETENRRLAAQLRELQASGVSERVSALQTEVDKMRDDLVAARAQNRRLADDLTAKSAAVERLNEVNDQLSTRTLAMANEAEGDKAALQRRLQTEADDLRRKLQKANDEADNERLRFQDQRVQMLDEMNSLQEEVGSLRAKLRTK